MTAETIAFIVLFIYIVASERENRRLRRQLSAERVACLRAEGERDVARCDLDRNVERLARDRDAPPISAATREAIAVAIHTPVASDVHDALDRIAMDARYHPHP